jgi:hypothetical protein
MLWSDAALAAAPRQTVPQLPELIATSQRSFEIPFTIGTASDDIVEVVLQMSTDRGRTWQEHSRRSPDSTAFPFSCREDQEIWFAIQTVDRNGQRRPAAAALRPELRIAVDTRNPTLQFQVRPDAAGRVVGTWVAEDPHIDPCSMLIEYRSVDASADDRWYQVPAQTCRTQVTGSFHDELAWWPEISASQLDIRATIKDLAGNPAVVARRIEVPQVAGQGIVGNSNPLRSGSSAAGSRSEASAAGKTPSPTTNYLRSRVPYALSDQFDPSARSATRPASSAAGRERAATPRPREIRENRLRDGSRLPDQSAVTPTSPPGPPATTVSQAGLSPDGLPQPPRSRANRFASNARPQAASSSSSTSSPSPSMPWQSQAREPDRTQIAAGSTVAGPLTGQTPVNESTTRVAQQPAYDDPSARPPLSGRSAVNTLPASSSPASSQPQVKRNDPLPSQTPAIPGSIATNNQDSSSSHAQWVSSTTGQSQQPPPQPASRLVSGPAMESLRRSAHPSDSTRFQLEYDIDAIGPEGVQAVELWITRDGGNSWRRLSTDEDRRSPVDVNVDEEGIYGFRILVISNEGLRARQPKSGDPADLWVNVDITSPTARITAVPYGRGPDAGKLLVQWRAADTNLRMRPVRLLYSPSAQGPWTTIEDGIRNQGQYAWKPGAEVPDQLYLKLEVRDVAGNVGVHQLNRPIDVSGLIPRGHIRGVRPLRDPPDRPSGDAST